MLELVREDPWDLEQGVDPEATVAAGQHDGGGLRGIELGGRGRDRGNGLERKLLGQLRELARDLAIVRLDPQAQRDHAPRDHERHPATSAELLDGCHRQNAGADDEAKAVDQHRLLPRLGASNLPPVSHHREVRQREREKHVDGVHDDERLEVATGVDEDHRRGTRHQIDTVVHRQLLGQRGELARQPLVERHVRHHARPVDETRLRGNDEQRALGDQRQDHEGLADLDARDRPVSGEQIGENGVESLPCMPRLARRAIDMQE